MVKEVVIDSSKSVLYTGDGMFMVSKETGTKGKSSAPAAPSSAVREELSGKFYMPWGDDNLHPQNIVTESSKSTQIAALIGWKIRTLVSGGIIYGRQEWDKDGNEKLIPFHDADIAAFCTKSAIKRYQREATSDYFWFNNIFPEIILTGDRSKVATITIQESCYSRYAPQNERTGLSPAVYISANWDKSPSEDACKKVPLVDPYYDPALTMRNMNGERFIYSCSFPSPNKFFYQDAEWHNLFNSAWWEIELSVPKTKLAILRSIPLRYHIKVPKSYWEAKYNNWHDLTIDERVDKKREELDGFNKFMKDEKNAGGSFMTEYDTNLDGTKYQGWIVESITNSIKDGAYIEDSQESSMHIMRALGLDPTLVGQGPGRNQGSAGSGSDKRVARDIWLLNAKADADVILEPLDVISEYNGWKAKYPNLVWWFRNYQIATQNQVSPKDRL